MPSFSGLSQAPHSCFRAWASKSLAVASVNHFALAIWSASLDFLVPHISSYNMSIYIYFCVPSWFRVKGTSASTPEISTAVVFVAVMTPEGFVEGKHRVFAQTSQVCNCEKYSFLLHFFTIASFSIQSILKSIFFLCVFCFLYCICFMEFFILQLPSSSRRLSKIDVDF